MKTINPDQLIADLRQFSGTTQWHRWSSLTNLVCTDGAKYLAEEAGAYWLLDAIASHQNAHVLRDSLRLQELQVWLLSVNADKSCRLTCAEDSDVAPVFVQAIEFTDFPLQEIKLYVCNNVVLLPSEY
ncbi:MAG: DUF6876 family protein [Cyanobacteria bacterium P01_D01_bin.36]